jgi:hypothetical protein
VAKEPKQDTSYSTERHLQPHVLTTVLPRQAADVPILCHSSVDEVLLDWLGKRLKAQIMKYLLDKDKKV